MDLSHWDARQSFTRREAGFLIAGADPFMKQSDPTVAAKAAFFATEIKAAFMRAYSLAFALVSYAPYIGDFPRGLSADVWSASRADAEQMVREFGHFEEVLPVEGNSEIVSQALYLPSIELRESIARVFRDPENYAMISVTDERYEEHFSRADLANWIAGVGLKSGYSFSRDRQQVEMASVPLARSYHSKQLTLCLQASDKFWQNADRSDKTTHPKNAVISQWLQRQGMKETKADDAASIIRPEWASVGKPPET